jgi:hypothetical protein
MAARYVGVGLPVNLRTTARNARPLASDLLTATLDADTSVHGQAVGNLAIGGKIDVLHAEVGSPKRIGSGANPQCSRCRSATAAAAARNRVRARAGWSAAM